jgi:3-methyladenine DNA glycosylase AlkD
VCPIPSHGLSSEWCPPVKQNGSLFSEIVGVDPLHLIGGGGRDADIVVDSDMPYFGVTAPLQNRLFRSVFAAHPLASFEQWYDTILRLWRKARCREERYAAIALSGHRRYRAYQTLDALPLYEELIVTGAWWDLVDGLASHQVGGLLRSYPEVMREIMLAWSRDPDLWKRRTAILCQLGFKSSTDEELLFDCILANLADRQFFIRKAIGWALREYAKTDPDAVRRFLGKHWSELSPLSRREAEKHLVTPAPG